MKTQYFKKHSTALGREMEYKTYGDKGKGVLVLPSQNGRFYDYQDFDMVAVLSPHIEAGRIHLICADSLDGESWSASNGDEHARIVRHEQWFSYIVDELIPSVTKPGERLIVTGCSMGGYHAANFFFRRPELFDTLLALSGCYHASAFFPGYTDPLVYDNSPIDYLSGMSADHPYLDLYRKKQIILCVGQGAWEDELLESTRRLDAILKEKKVPAWVDYWGYDVSHDWPWWRKQIVYFMDKLLTWNDKDFII